MNCFELIQEERKMHLKLMGLNLRLHFKQIFDQAHNGVHEESPYNECLRMKSPIVGES